MTIQQRDPFFASFEDISNYLEQRMNTMFAPFSEDFHLSVQPTTRIEEGPSGKQLMSAPKQQVVGRWPLGTGWPRLDVVERDAAVEVTAELPGVAKDDIQVHLDENRLFIKAKREETKKREESDRYHYSERHYGSMERIITLPPNIDPDQVKSSFDNGVLHLQFAKKEPQDTRKQISIQ